MTPHTPTASVKAGDVIAEKYVVEHVLAEGGMGVVVAARHTKLQRRVALKFLLPNLCRQGDVVARFLREAQAMTAIQNEHVARVLDVGTTSDGAPYMVMEYLEGEDLADMLAKRGPLPLGEVVDYILQAMEALAEAHLHGFVHRDLKPSNIFVTHRPDGSPLVKVLDFGISKVVTDSAEDGRAALTQAHGLLGSPLYMAPEQIRSSKTVDARADIWALGIILYELLAGRPPFEGETIPAVLAAIIGDEPVPLRKVVRMVPATFSAIIDQCLTRDRAGRYESVGELAVALGPFATQDGQHSLERIERVAAHQRRLSSAPDLKSAHPRQPSSAPALDVFAATAQGDVTILPSSGSRAAAPVAMASPAAETVQAPTSASVKTNVKTNIKTRAADLEDMFGKYRLIAVLGQGGMADVFLAVLAGPEGLGFSKLVVIKRLRASLAHDPEFVGMLIDEARIAAQLNHPNVVQTHEVGVIDGEYYIAMEYLDGQPLNRIVERVRSSPSVVEGMPLAFRLGMVRDMLAGVHHAHELADFDGTPLGLVHRDVSPHNVFVTYEGQVKVVDFGIAKARGRAVETQEGMLKGKVAYMAPEQASGQDVDGRADVFGAGVVLWELLTGERMWKGTGDVAIIQHLMLGKIPSSARAVNPEVPKALDAIVMKAIQRKQKDRFESARAFQLAIERYMEAEGLKCGSRELGEWLAALFEDRRKETRGLIEAQLSALRTSSQPPRSIDLSDLRDSKGGQTPSALRLARLDRGSIPVDLESRPDSVMARSNPGSAVTSSSLVSRAKSRLAIIGGAALVVVIVGVAVASRGRPPASQGARLVPSTELTTLSSAVPPETASTPHPEPTASSEIAPSASVASAPPTPTPTPTRGVHATAPAPTRRPVATRPPPGAPVAASARAPVPCPSPCTSGRPKRTIDNDNPYGTPSP